MKSRIVAWNRKRGLLENFDPQLEIKMLSEEAREFYMAEELPHMLQEFADFLFVKHGTKAKFYAMKHPSPIMFASNNENFRQLLHWAEYVEDEIKEILVSKYIEEEMNTEYLDTDIEVSLGFVTIANQKKGTKKVDGKVVKGEAYQSPLEMIKEYLRR